MKATLKLHDMLQIPLASAYLCADCNCIGNCADRCPVCASQVLLGLSSVLNRNVSAEPHRLPMNVFEDVTTVVEVPAGYSSLSTVAA